MRETDLHAPVKAFLAGQGYDVKGEVGGCDLLAVRGDEAPVVVELKLRLSLELVLQGVDRLQISDAVYLAVPRRRRRERFPGADDSRVRQLCRRLGLGLLSVDVRAGHVEVLVDPVPYRPRKDRGRLTRLLGEHARRVGDPNRGGSRGIPLVTAYRQDALRCARLLAAGPLSMRALRAAGAPVEVSAILQRDYYGWFARVARGTYGLSDAGREALLRFADALPP